MQRFNGRFKDLEPLSGDLFEHFGEVGHGRAGFVEMLVAKPQGALFDQVLENVAGERFHCFKISPFPFKVREQFAGQRKNRIGQRIRVNLFSKFS